MYPRTSNHTDFDPLRLHPDIDFDYVSLQTQALAQTPEIAADLLILPGSKNVRADLAFLREQGWDKQIAKHLRYGGKLLGICGGYQMLGERIADPMGIEDTLGVSLGLGYLPIATEFKAEKQLRRVTGHLALLGQQVEVKGYEIHCGESQYLAPHYFEHQCLDLSAAVKSASLWLKAENSQQVNPFADGCLSDDGQVLGSYLHGLFDSPEACQLVLHWAGLENAQTIDINEIREQQLDRLAYVLAEHLDMQKLASIINA
ncbi:cobyric acid synthase [Shewanella seohaensis]|uniref:hypothetical protein n=1 Tax=Shewanella seohaensis TaxID=755175 RepID=UPI0036F1FCFA